MPAKDNLDTASIVLQATQSMIDRHDACRRNALAEDYERCAEKAPPADAAEALASLLRQPAAPVRAENEVSSNKGERSRRGASGYGTTTAKSSSSAPAGTELDLR
jgi:hypothetical protein